jgi:hypothetical protein
MCTRSSSCILASFVTYCSVVIHYPTIVPYLFRSLVMLGLLLFKEMEDATAR